MDIPQHQRRERLAIASLAGLASRYLAGQDSIETTIEAMRGVTRDPHLLAHAIGPSSATEYLKLRELLEAAGVTPELLDNATAETDKRLAAPDFLRAFADGINAAPRNRRR